MTKQEFKRFCDTEFKKRGFIKKSNAYYLAGKDLLCVIDLQKSNYGEEYYINYSYFLGEYRIVDDYPKPIGYPLCDIFDRISVMSKTQTTDGGKHYMTGQIEYEYYTEDELRLFFDKAFDDVILPPVHQGKKYILDHLNELYTLDFHKEETMRKLLS